MTALTVDTPIAPPPAKADVPTPGQLAADNALRRAHESVVTDGLPTPTWVVVSPAMAEAWLTHLNPEDQRRLRPQDVAKYARTMVRGDWRPTGDPVQFAKEDGSLLNGQHRLAAIVKARKSVPLLVLTDVEKSTRDAMDMGIKRTTSDKLAMDGFKYTMHLGSVARLVWDLQTGTSIKPTKPSDTELLDMIKNDPELVWVVTEVLPHLRVLGSKTVVAYCYLMFHRKDPQQAAEFFEKVEKLTDLPNGSPIAALDRRFRKQAAGNHKDKIESVGLIISAWNAWRAGETRERIMLKAHKDGHYEVPEVK